MRVLALAIATFLGTGCVGTNSPQAAARSSAELVITARDYSFNVPAHVRPGRTTLILSNAGNEPHQATVLRLNRGVTKQKLLDAFASDASTRSALALITAVGGPNTALPGKQVKVQVDLAPGEYVVLCFVRSPDGQDHLAKGMVATFKVNGARRASKAPAGVGGEVTLAEMTISLPPRINAGQRRLRVVNRGAQVHELVLLKVAPGHPLSDLQSYLTVLSSGGPPPGVAPFLEAGGLTALGPGRSAVLEVDLDPGNYAALCLVPDPAHGVAHLAEGMLAYFEVA